MPGPAHRVWIDTDPACGAGPRVDPDDCLAIAYLALHGGTEIAGLSTVFGNASAQVTERTARRLADLLARQEGAPIEVHRGATEPTGTDGPRPTAASDALIEALSAGSLTILALGPLTNLAAALEDNPGLHGNVERIVAVMGRRPGHIFHPAEGNDAGALFGHGPFFRDFNVVKDVKAVDAVIGMDLPLVLIPYEAASRVEIDGADLDRIASTGPAGRWIAQRARPWLEYWNTDIGRPGFYPFDLLAAVFVTDPDRFACAETALRIGRDDEVIFPFNLMQALLVEPREHAAVSADPVDRLYCHGYEQRIGIVSIASRDPQNPDARSVRSQQRIPAPRTVPIGPGSTRPRADRPRFPDPSSGVVRDVRRHRGRRHGKRGARGRRGDWRGLPGCPWPRPLPA